MMYSGNELLWLFLVYSFLGWIFETIMAAIRQKKFVNKGLINLPFCMLYGMVAVFITVFGRELQGAWLYIGCVIIVVAFRGLAGGLIEKIFHERWWDYSNRRFNIGGYVCLTDALIWGIVAVIMVKWGNSLLVSLFDFMPHLLKVMIPWTLLVLLAIDMIATLIVMNGKSAEVKQWAELERRFTDVSAFLGQKIYSGIEKRVKRAYPNARRVENAEGQDSVFAYGCCFYKLVWLFMIGSLLGDITETIFCRITAGVWMSRSSVVWGPFSIVWGLAIVFATILLHKYKDKPDRILFLAGTVLGGAYEYVCSVFTEIVFGKVFWDYSKIRFNLGGRINLLYCFFWGIAAVVWIKLVYPKISAWIEKLPVKMGKIISWILVIFMCCNVIVSCMALTRSTQRAESIAAEYSWQKIMDERFDDKRMQRIYPNAISTD